jgi:hypothetical protein
VCNPVVIACVDVNLWIHTLPKKLLIYVQKNHLISLVSLINKTFFFSSADGSERNSESLLLFFFYGTEYRVVFFSSEGFGTEFRGFLFRGTAGIPSEITSCSVYSVFRGIIFLSEIPNPTNKAHHRVTKNSRKLSYMMNTKHTKLACNIKKHSKRHEIQPKRMTLVFNTAVL